MSTSNTVEHIELQVEWLQAVDALAALVPGEVGKCSTLAEAIVKLGQAKRDAELALAILRGTDFRTALDDWNKMYPDAERVLGLAW